MLCKCFQFGKVQNAVVCREELNKKEFISTKVSSLFPFFKVARLISD